MHASILTTSWPSAPSDSASSILHPPQRHSVIRSAARKELPTGGRFSSEEPMGGRHLSYPEVRHLGLMHRSALEGCGGIDRWQREAAGSVKCFRFPPPNATAATTWTPGRKLNSTVSGTPPTDFSPSAKQPSHPARPPKAAPDPFLIRFQDCLPPGSAPSLAPVSA